MSQYKLVIAEKPSVAQSIAAVLGATGPQGRIYGRKRLHRELMLRASGGALQRRCL